MQHLVAPSPAHRSCWINAVNWINIKKCFAFYQVPYSYDRAEHHDKPGRLLGSGSISGMVARKWQLWLWTLQSEENRGLCWMESLHTTHSGHRQGLVLSSNFPRVPWLVNRVISLPVTHLRAAGEGRAAGQLGCRVPNCRASGQHPWVVTMGSDLAGPVQALLSVASFLVRIHFSGNFSASGLEGYVCLCVSVAARWSCFLIVRFWATSSTSLIFTYEMSM